MSTFIIVCVGKNTEFSTFINDQLTVDSTEVVIKTTSRGKDGLTLLREHPVDCIISEYGLLDMDGVEFVRGVRKNHADIPVIMYTDSGDEAVASDAIAAGVTAYIPRETDAESHDQLLASINEIQATPSKNRSRNRAPQRRRETSQIGASAAGQEPMDSDEGITEQEVQPVDHQLFRWVVDEANVAMTLIDPTGDSESVQYTYANQAFREMTGYTEREIRNCNCQFLTGPETDDEKVTTVRQAIDNQESVTVELQTYHADSTKFWNRLTLTPITDDSGQAVSYLGTHRDITVEKRRTSELISERRQMSQAINTLEDIFYVLDTDGTLLRWNNQLSEETGYTAAELDSMYASELFAKHERAKIGEAIETTLRGEEVSIEVDMLAANGKQIPFEVSGSRLLDADGDTMGIVGVGRKIIERKERRQHLKLLERVLRHNVRNRINVIQGRAEIVRDNSCNGTEQSARSIIDASSQLINIMEKEREVVAILRNPPETVCLDIQPALTNAVSAVKSSYPAVEVAIESPDGIDIAVDQQFPRALEELIENAVVHNDTDYPAVRVAVSRCSDGIEVEISDNCPEIPPIERDVLIEDTTRTPLYHGSGLGLSLIRLLTRRSGGRIDYDKNTPTGNTITLTLPESDATSG